MDDLLPELKCLSFAHAQERFKFIAHGFKSDLDRMCVKPDGSFVAAEEDGVAILKWQPSDGGKPFRIAHVKIVKRKG